MPPGFEITVETSVSCPHEGSEREQHQARELKMWMQNNQGWGKVKGWGQGKGKRREERRLRARSEASPWGSHWWRRGPKTPPWATDAPPRSPPPISNVPLACPSSVGLPCCLS